MVFRQRSRLDHLQGIKEVLGDADANVYGPFIWEEDLFGKKNGIYAPIGRIILPMSIEGRVDGRKGVAFTVFSDAYFAGEGCSNVATGTDTNYCHNLCDWDPSLRDNGYTDVQGREFMLGPTNITTTEPLSAVKAHIETILRSKDELEKRAAKTGTEKLVKRIFIEY